MLAFDHVRKQIWMVVTADVTLAEPDEAYDKAVKRLAKLEKRLAQPLPKLPQAQTRPSRAGEAPHQQEEIFSPPWSAPRNTSPPATFFRRSFRSGSM